MKKPYIIAITMFLLISLWMISGIFTADENNEQSSSQDDTNSLMLVETQTQDAQTIPLSITIQGSVEPNRHISIRNDVAGTIAKVHAQEGQWVTADTLLFELNIEDREIKLAKENAILSSRQKSYERTEKLVKQGLQPTSALEDAFSALKTAQANVAQIEFEIDKLSIRAPFDGVVDTLLVEQNSYVAANTELVSFVDNSKLIVVAPVAQQSVHRLNMGSEATIDFATGETVKGTVRFVSPMASVNTRTFRVEVEVDNASRSIPAGISAEINIPTSFAQGHFVSPAVLVLDEAGQIGVKSVNQQDTVVFNPVTIIKSSAQGVWIEGLPATANIITVGQGFVQAGVKVKHQEAESSNEQLSMENDKDTVQ